MVTDARISTGLPDHPKTKKLIRRLGQAAAWNLVRLILWTAANRSDGDMTGMSNEDLELSGDWLGEEGALVRALVEVRFLDGEEGAYRFHDWADHNPWAAGSEKRSEKASWAALCKQHGRQEAARMMPEYAARLRHVRQDSEQASQVPAAGLLDSANSTATSVLDAVPDSATSTQVAVPDSATGMQLAQPSSAPSPSPSPSPSPKEDTPQPPDGGQQRRRKVDGEPEGFAEFWAAYPRKVGKDDARKAFVKRKPDEELIAQMLKAIREQAQSDQWSKDGGKFIPHPSTWLNRGQWGDGDGEEGAVQGDSENRPQWALQAGFENRWEAENERCYAHNAHLFRGGLRVEVPA